MQTFNEYKETSLNENLVLKDDEFTYLNESERNELQEVLIELGDKKISELDEGLLGRVFGGVTGFIVGPAIGKVVAAALGIDKGVVYDMLTSRLVSTALGSAIAKHISARKR